MQVSGAPVLLAYNKDKGADGTAALGMVTETLCVNNSAIGGVLLFGFCASGKRRLPLQPAWEPMPGA